MQFLIEGSPVQVSVKRGKSITEELQRRRAEETEKVP